MKGVNKKVGEAITYSRQGGQAAREKETVVNDIAPLNMLCCHSYTVCLLLPNLPFCLPAILCRARANQDVLLAQLCSLAHAWPISQAESTATH